MRLKIAFDIRRHEYGSPLGGNEFDKVKRIMLLIDVVFNVDKFQTNVFKQNHNE